MVIAAAAALASASPRPPALLECRGSGTGSGTLAGAFGVLDDSTLGDTVATLVLALGPAICGGDCDGDGAVTVDEIVTGVTIALGDAPGNMPVFDTSGEGQVTVDELIAASTQRWTDVRVTG